MEPCGSGGGGYLAYFGRLNHNKGIHVAICVARMVGLPIKIAGPNHDPESFDRYIRHRLRDGVVDYVGQISDPQAKLKFLSNAVALLNPIFVAGTIRP
jgi:glycosyltransferase involved in cell wall biosynthesis